MTNWTEDDMRLAEAMGVAPLDREDCGTDYDKRDEFWKTLFYGVLILCAASLFAGLLSAWLPMPEGF